MFKHIGTGDSSLILARATSKEDHSGSMPVTALHAVTLKGRQLNLQEQEFLISILSHAHILTTAIPVRMTGSFCFFFIADTDIQLNFNFQILYLFVELECMQKWKLSCEYFHSHNKVQTEYSLLSTKLQKHRALTSPSLCYEPYFNFKTVRTVSTGLCTHLQGQAYLCKNLNSV